MDDYRDYVGPPAHHQSMDQLPEIELVQEKILWSAKRRPIFGLPISFTRYTLYSERLMIQTGFFTRRTEEIRLYRVLDVSLRQSLGQRLFQIGSIKLQTADATAPKVFIHDVRHSEQVHRLLSDVAEQQRKINRMGIMEYLDGF